MKYVIRGERVRLKDGVLAIIPEDVDHLPTGTKVPVMMLDWPEDK